jgi:hypothetical protein
MVFAKVETVNPRNKSVGSVSGFTFLDVETEVDDVTLLHDVVFAFQS